MVPETVAQEPLIRLENLNKSFVLADGGRFDAVRDVSLTVNRGDALGLIGRSGAGKSTLLRLMNLLERPDSGRVFVSGQELTALGKAQLRDARQKIGMIFQQFNLLQNATVFENIAFPLRIHGRHRRAEITERVRACAAIVGLSDRLDHYPAQLSGGQKQRVAIARALAMEPDIMLFDEPTSALDPELTGEVLRTMRQLAQEHMTMLVVTHEMAFAREVAHRVCFMDKGKIVEERAARAFFEDPHHERARAFLEHVL